MRALPGGAELLALAGAREDLALIGGAVRDILIDRAPRELDVALDSGASELAGELAAILAGPGREPRVTVHERFGTAAVAWEGGRVDLAQRRAESYPEPGALPVVRAGTAAEDLERRDFTVNAISVALAGPRAGSLESAEDALEDLAARRLRVLHEESFLEDPTRLVRLARYSARLGFAAEEATAALAARALEGGALATVSRARLGAELRLALGEADPLAALGSLARLGVLEALDPSLSLDRDLAARAIAILPQDGRVDLLLLSQALLASTRRAPGDPEAALRDLLDAFEFGASERDRVISSVLGAPGLVEELRAAVAPSEIHEVLAWHTPETVALAAALDGGPEAGARAGETARAACEWLERLRHVRLAITGDDLLAAGVPAGPRVGRGLAVALARKLDGELEEGRDAELRAALEGSA